LKGTRRRSLYILAAATLAILTTGLIFWNHFKYKFVNKKLDNLVEKKSKGLYQVTYRNLVIDEPLGNLSVENIEMVPDSQVYQNLVAAHAAPRDLFYIRIPELRITGVKTPKALLHKEISAHIIRIENAEIEIRVGKSDKEKKTNFKKILNGEMYRQLLGNLKSIQSDSIVLENANLTIKDLETNTIQGQATGLSIRFAGALIDSLAPEDSSRILFSTDLAVHCNQFLLPFKNKTYNFVINGLDYSSSNRRFHADQIRLKPLLSETSFAKINPFAKDRFDITLGPLDIDQIDRQAMLKEELVAAEINIRNLSLRVFRDKSYPHDSVDRTHEYPQESIMSLPWAIYIRKIVVADSYIEYKEKNDRSDSSGKVSFFHVLAQLENVTNMAAKIRQQNQMILHFHALFLNESLFAANINMQLNDKQGHFSLDAKLDTLRAASLNPLLRPMALAELDRGRINQLVYHLDATNTKGKGNLDFLYEDLSVKLLKKDDDKNQYKTKGLPTLAAGLLIKHSNPQHGHTRKGNVEYSRDIHRSIFNLMWKSLFSGIKQIAL
jgi:hypothetical protein